MSVGGHVGAPHVVDARHGLVFDGVPGTPTLVERVRGRLAGTGSWTHWAVVRRAALRRDGDRRTPRFVLRVDDFPRWDRGPEGFMRCHRILRDAGIRYVLGVIPQPAQDPADAALRDTREWSAEETAALAEAAPDLEVALHGLTHHRGSGRIPAESAGVPPQVVAAAVDEGLARLAARGLTARAYIPPYNAIDWTSVTSVADRLPVICGGPESVRWLGCLPAPCRLARAWFLPSYPPAYGRATEVAAFVRAVRTRALPLLIPLAIHWAWEEADAFDGVRRLADVLRGAAVTLASWQEGHAWA